ncbi:MAG: T9SS type A sorting domain-containing protein, partial [Bacteroidia bacterium]|nr:T9SS type A sorting domain-containing protein [Bacteroidia bacterium]
SEKIYIVTSNPIKKCIVQLINSLNELVLQQEGIFDNISEIPVYQLSSGIYTLKFTEEGAKSIYKKFIINK